MSADKTLHPLLGQRLDCAGEQEIFESLIGEDFPAYLSHHRVFDRSLFPTTAYLEMATAAGNYHFKTPHLVVENLIIRQGWILPAGKLILAQTILTPSDNQSYQFQIFTQQEQHKEKQQKWILHATGKIRPNQTNIAQTKVDIKKYQAECNQPIEVKQHYQQFQKIGIDYGSSFQGIHKLWSGSNQALAQIKLPEELIAETTDYQFHPALLDAALQVIAYVLPPIDADSDKTYLPVGIEHFQVYGRPGLSLWAYASIMTPVVESKESLNIQATLVNSEGEIIAIVKGLQVKLATQQTLLGTEVESIKNWLYEVEWRTKGRLGKLLPPDFLLPPVEISQQLTPTLTKLVAQIDNQRTWEIGTNLEELSVDYIVQALLSMGWSHKPKENFDIQAAAEGLGIVPSYLLLFQRLLQILAEVGILEYKQEQWQVQQALEKVNPREKSQSLLSRYSDEAAALTLLDRCASELNGVLRGTIDPVQLVFPQGDLTTTTQLYQESAVAKVMNTIVQKSIAKAMENLPKSRGIRFLEIGAGTGGTTSYILPHLNPNQTEYLFTDIGALFTSKAQEKFRDYRFMGYQTLDIEVDPTTQGFQSHQYDVIIAANVLHATTNIKQTLSHVQQLLAPGGMLVLYEATTRSRYADLIFGLLEGWWKFTDYELRPDYPLLSRQQWKKVLSETGFTQIVTLPEIEGVPETLSAQTVIVAQADKTTLEQSLQSPKGWLILADKQGIAQQLARKLNSVGDVCTLVFAGEKYQQIAPEEFTINPDNIAEFEQVIKTVAAKSPSLSGVVQCWTTEAGVAKTINSEELENLSKLGCGTTLSLVQALVKGGLSKSPHLWLVTCGSQPLPSNHPVIPGVAQSPVWGMGKVISLEHPELNCVRIDLDPQERIESQADALFKEIWSEDKEDQVAWRRDCRYVPRLVASRHRQPVAERQPEIPLQQADTTTKKSLSFREDATYLITGGMGGLGLLVARWMVSKGAKHLVLVGRRSPDDSASQKLTELEMLGAEVVVEKADVSSFAAMKEVLNRISQSNIPLAGVIHSAGMLSDGVLQNQTWSSFEQVMAPKVQGTWHLHQLTQDQPLEFFVLFSSGASLFGSPGQGNHSAANAFLDGLAHYRCALGLPGLSINWGAVSQVGEAAERGADVRAQKRGIGAISPTQMLESLELLMSSTAKAEENLSEVGVVPIDWSSWQQEVAKWSFLEDWQEIIQTTAEISQSEFMLKLEATEPSERRSLLVAHVRRQLALVLGINHPESISLETSFFDLGMDSLTSIELRNKLQSSLGCRLSEIPLFNYANIDDLVNNVAQDVLGTISLEEDESLPDKWKTIQLPHKLEQETQPIAGQINYELPSPNEQQQAQISATSSIEKITMEEKFIEFRGNQICLCNWGLPDAPVVLCIHGILEQGLAWQEVALPLAAQGYRVVAPDLFGHGRSAHLGMVTSYNSLLFLAQIDRVIQELPDQPLLLVGHSMGAMLASAIASVRPHKIKELILVEPILPADQNKQEPVVNQLTTCLDYLSSPTQHPTFPDVATAASKLRQATPSLSEEFSYILAQRTTEPYQGGVRWSWDTILRTHFVLNFNNFHGGRSQYLEMLKSIQVPTTLVYGNSSKLNRPEDLQQQQIAMTQAKRIFLPGGHNLHIDAAAALVSLILTSQ